MSLDSTHLLPLKLPKDAPFMLKLREKMGTMDGRNMELVVGFLMFLLFPRGVFSGSSRWFSGGVLRGVGETL